MKRESIDPVISRLGLSILDGEKKAILLLANRLDELGHPNAGRVRELHNRPHYSAPKDESLAVLLALPDQIGWLLACDFADHWMEGIHADTSQTSNHAKIIQICRSRATGPIDEMQLSEWLKDAPGYYQYWAKAKNGNEAAMNALAGILAFSATGGKEPAWQQARIRAYLLCDD